jgi:hypothetical protein
VSLLTRLSCFAVCAALAGSATFALARSEIEAVTSIVVTPASGGSNAQADEPEGVKILMREINEQRPKLWKPYRGKLGPCAVRLTFFEQDRRVARLVLDGNQLIEFEPASTSVGSAREVHPSELAGIRRLASKVKDQRSCGK